MRLQHVDVQQLFADLALQFSPVAAGKSIKLKTHTQPRQIWGDPVVLRRILGNLLSMTVVVGQLYIDSPLRLCNAYLLDDQVRLGHWLIGLAALVALVWLAQVGWWLVRREAASEALAPKGA